MLGKCCGLLVVAVSVLVGLLFSGTLAKYGVFHAIAKVLAEQYDYPFLVGMTPGFMLEEELKNPNFKFQDVKDGSLKGKTGLVTGQAGLGYWTAVHMARAGVDTTVACRSEKKCNAAIKEMEKELKNVKNQGKLTPMIVDLSSFASVKEFAGKMKERVNVLDIVVLNAGIAVADPKQPIKITKDGLEQTLATNHFGSHLLIKNLIPIIEKSNNPRIVVVSSAANYEVDEKLIEKLFDIEKMNSPPIDKQYSVSKLANVLFAQELAKRYPGIKVNSVHPGAVATNIFDPIVERIKHNFDKGAWKYVGDFMLWSFYTLYDQAFFSAEQGSLSQVFLAISPKVEEQNISGKYFHPIAREIGPNKLAVGKKGEEYGQRLWDFSEKVLKDRGF